MTNNVTTISDQFIKKIYESGNWCKFSFFAIIILIEFNGSMVVFTATFTSASIDFQCQDEGNSSLYLYQNNSCSIINKETNKSIPCSNKYIFFPNDRFMSSSAISHFQLVCERSYLNFLSQSLLIWGLFIGGFIGPIIGDIFGRQKIMLSSTFLCGVIGILIAFSPNFTMFAIGKFLLGILREISMTTGFVLALEIIPSHQQTNFGMFNQMIWCITIIIIGILAFFFRDWQYFQVIGSFPCLFTPMFIIIISESPRWIISKGKIRDLETLIKSYVEKWNGAKIKDFDELFKNLHNNKETLLINKKSKNTKEYNVFDIFRSKYLCLWTFILIFTWIYGITAIYSLNSITTLLPGNPYLNYCLSGFLDAIGVIVVFFVIGISRNITALSFQIISFVTFITAGFISENLKYLTNGLIILGKMALNGNLFLFSISSLYIYPSSLRATGTNISGSVGKLVAIFSPYFIRLFKEEMSLPMTILGVFALLVGISNIFFPDWLNRPLPETIEDAEQLKRNIYFPCCNTEPSDQIESSTKMLDVL